MIFMNSQSFEKEYPAFNVVIRENFLFPFCRGKNLKKCWNRWEQKKREGKNMLIFATEMLKNQWLPILFQIAPTYFLLSM